MQDIQDINIVVQIVYINENSRKQSGRSCFAKTKHTHFFFGRLVLKHAADSLPVVAGSHFSHCGASISESRSGLFDRPTGC